jgi:hypothetical protein
LSRAEEMRVRAPESTIFAMSLTPS